MCSFHSAFRVGQLLLSADAVKQYIGGGAKLMLQQGLEATGGIPGDDFNPIYKEVLPYYAATTQDSCLTFSPLRR
jgi:phosphoglycolate phosphatase